MNYKHLEDWNSGTVERIINRYPRGFFGAVIQGERGLGKSMYAYKVMAKVYMMTENLTEVEAYAKALEHFIFEPKELMDLVKKNVKNKYVTPVICLDDATVHFNSYKFFTDLYEVILLKGIFDTIRTAVTGLLFTCPNRRSLLRFLRDYDDHKISIISYDGFERMDRYARCYKFNWYPDERKCKVLVPYQDSFSCFVPDEYYKPYLAKRNYYLEMINTKMEELMKRSNRQKELRRLKNEIEVDIDETERELDA